MLIWRYPKTNKYYINNYFITKDEFEYCEKIKFNSF